MSLKTEELCARMVLWTLNWTPSACKTTFPSSYQMSGEHVGATSLGASISSWSSDDSSARLRLLGGESIVDIVEEEECGLSASECDKAVADLERWQRSGRPEGLRRRYGSINLITRSRSRILLYQLSCRRLLAVAWAAKSKAAHPIRHLPPWFRSEHHT